MPGDVNPGDIRVRSQVVGVVYVSSYGAVPVCVEGTAPAGGWIRRRRRRATGRRRAGKRRIELSLNENFCFSDQHRKLRGAFCLFRKGNRLELSVNESKCEGAGGVSHGEPQQEDGARRLTTRTHIVIMRTAIVFFQGFLRGSSTTCYLRH